MSQALIRKTRQCQKLQTLDLTEVGSFAQRKEIQELRDVVAPCGVRRSVIESCGMGKHYSPNAMVGTLLPKAGTNRSTLFLDDGSFVRYRLGRANIADELLHYSDG